MSTFDSRPVEIAGEQMILIGMGPQSGERYRNRNTGVIATVLDVTQRHYAWVTLRIHGEQSTIPLAQFQRVFARL